MATEKSFPTAKGTSAIYKMAAEAGVQTGKSGLKNGMIVIVPSEMDIESRIRNISGTDGKYLEFKLNIDDVEKWTALGSLYRSHKFHPSEEFQRPNGIETLEQLLPQICGETIVLKQIENAIAPETYGSETYKNCTVFTFDVK